MPIYLLEAVTTTHATESRRLSPPVALAEAVARWC
eukprot:COSAG06_NODE_5693_length_3315_cov_330.218216_3_plen_35_part_00